MTRIRMYLSALWASNCAMRAYEKRSVVNIGRGYIGANVLKTVLSELHAVVKRRVAR
jgi:hypothetical protein